MKKILLIMALIPAIAFAQDSTKLNAKQVYDDVKEGFYKLVNTLEGPAKHTYQVYVKQQLVTGWSALISMTIPMIIALLLMFRSFKLGKWDSGDPENKWAIGQIVFSIMFCILLLATILNAGSIVSRITNPEYNAIQDIVTTVK